LLYPSASKAPALLFREFADGQEPEKKIKTEEFFEEFHNNFIVSFDDDPKSNEGLSAINLVQSDSSHEKSD
jgi:hypothetical protein